MFSESAELYDLIYSTFKDYVAEAAQIAALLRSVYPECRTVLDVACGTGEHARVLAATHGLVVDGLDLDSRFVEIARLKHSAGRFVQADMADFSLSERYDAITCLFSSIGYLRTLEQVSRALRCFREHLAAGGVVIVEPWFAPGVRDPARVSTHTSEGHGVRVERVSHVEVDERVSRLRFDYRITTDDGVREVSELHELGLFTPAEMTQAFEAAGFAVRFDPEGLIGRGLYVARIAV